MFCSRCGKTLPLDAKRCKHCGLDAGEAAFSSTSYTSSPPIRWGEDPVYTVEEPENAPLPNMAPAMPIEEDDPFANTAYRHALPQEQAKAQEDMPEAAQHEGGAGEDEQKAAPKAEGENKEEGAGAPAPVFELPKVEKPGVSEDLKRQIEARVSGGKAGEEIVVPDPVGKRLQRALLILLSLGAVLVLVFLVTRFANAPTAPIENVTKTLYDEGMKVLGSRITAEYQQSIHDIYKADMQNGIQTGEAQLAEYAGMMPAQEGSKGPMINDALFVQALTSIQEVINNAALQTYLAVSVNNTSLTPEVVEAKKDEANALWTAAKQSYERLGKASTAQNLQEIIQGTSQAIPTPSPAPTPSPEPLKRLKLGDRGQAVQRLQDRLYELKYFDDVRDGIYGDKTVRAVAAFQKAVGIQDDGVARVSMQELLFAPDAPVSQATPKPSKTPKSTKTPKPDSTEKADEAEESAAPPPPAA